MRYIRQTTFGEIGEEGQKKLLESSVLVIGCGALGSTTSNLLTRAGIGNLKIIDRDRVELHNLQRQTLFFEKDVGKVKAPIVEKRLREANSETEIRGIHDDVSPKNIMSYLECIDLVCDCTDNMQTRFLINDACVKLKIPWIYAGVVASYGATMNIIPEKTPCFRCIFPAMPSMPLPTVATAGILNGMPAIMASIQSTEVLKILLGKEPRNSMLFYDVWDQDFQLAQVRRNPECPCCVKREFHYLDAEK